MTKYAQAVEKLVDLNEFLESNSITPPRTEFTSNIGEWMVMDELLKRGYSPKLQSGQYEVDILLSDGRGVEVKSATEDSRFGGVWLFDGIHREKFDYLICVQLTEDYNTAKFFVFTSADSKQIPFRNSSDDSVNTRLFRIYKSLDRAPSDQGRRLNEHLDEFVNAWQKLEHNNRQNSLKF